MLQLRITLLNTQPPIWRRVAVSPSLSFLQLHRVIQAAMGWEDCHLHEFDVGGERIGTAAEQDSFFSDRPAYSESRTRLGEMLGRRKKFRYWYDFGDDWWHEIVIEKRLPAGEGDPPARLLGGENACPPEDCGGPWGYAHLCAVFADPAHPEREEALDWLGEEFDPKAFDAEAAAKRVLRCVRASGKKKPA